MNQLLVNWMIKSILKIKIFKKSHQEKMKAQKQAFSKI